MGWILYELSRHPEDQERVYKEIKARSDKGYDSLEWLGCCVKVRAILLVQCHQIQIEDIGSIEAASGIIHSLSGVCCVRFNTAGDSGHWIVR